MGAQRIRQPEQAEPGTWGSVTHPGAIWTGNYKGAPLTTAKLEEVCQLYWTPLYAYIRHRGYGVEEAQDLTQEFFARLVERRWLEQVNPARGKLRFFLLGALKHFLANERRRSHAVKRGGGRLLVSLEVIIETHSTQEPTSGLTPEKLYERRWALSVLERAQSRLCHQYTADGKSKVCKQLKEFLWHEPENGEYAHAGAQLGMSNGAVSAAVYRLRERYRKLVREEIARTVVDPAEIEEEMRALLAALG